METNPGGGGEEVPEQGTQEPETDTPASPEEEGGGDTGGEDAKTARFLRLNQLVLKSGFIGRIAKDESDAVLFSRAPR